MDDRERSVSAELDYQLATRYFASGLNTLIDCPPMISNHCCRR